MSEARNQDLMLDTVRLATGKRKVRYQHCAAPLSPSELAIAGRWIVSGSAIPGAEWLLDWRDGKKTIQENGLHYL